MKNKFLILPLIIASLCGISQVSARSLKLDNQYLQAYQPHYLRLSIGNHLGCADISNCTSHRYEGSLSSNNATMTIAREILVTSDEVLDNSARDWGKPAEKIDFDFNTPFYKGVVVKLFPNKEATVDDKLVLKIKVDGQTEQTVDIPYLWLSPDSLNIFVTSIPLDSNSETATLKGKLEMQALSFWVDGEFQPDSFNYRLIMLNKMFSLEKLAREKLMKGEISNANYLQLQDSLDLIWDSSEFNGWQANQLERRYARLKKMLEEGKTNTARIIGSLNQLLKSFEKSWMN